jgi:long-chain acyl-CoA synthetase
VKIEASLKRHPIVQEAVLTGDGRHFCTALFALDPEMLSELAAREGLKADSNAAWVKELLDGIVAEANLSELAAREGLKADSNAAWVKELLDGIVAEANRGLASFETVKAWRVVPRPFTVAGGELTASLKVKRRYVEEQYMDLIVSMYDVKR